MVQRSRRQLPLLPLIVLLGAVLLPPHTLLATPSPRRMSVPPHPALSGTLHMPIIPNTTITTVPVGFFPNRIAVDPLLHRAYTATMLGNSVSVINLLAPRTIATIQVGIGPTGIAVNLRTNRGYVTNSSP